MPDPNLDIHLNENDIKATEIVVPVREEKNRVFTQVTLQSEFDGRFKHF